MVGKTTRAELSARWVEYKLLNSSEAAVRSSPPRRSSPVRTRSPPRRSSPPPRTTLKERTPKKSPPKAKLRLDEADGEEQKVLSAAYDEARLSVVFSRPNVELEKLSVRLQDGPELPPTAFGVFAREGVAPREDPSSWIVAQAGFGTFDGRSIEPLPAPTLGELEGLSAALSTLEKRTRGAVDVRYFVLKRKPASLIELYIRPVDGLEGEEAFREISTAISTLRPSGDLTLPAVVLLAPRVDELPRGEMSEPKKRKSPPKHKRGSATPTRGSASRATGRAVVRLALGSTSPFLDLSDSERLLRVTTGRAPKVWVVLETTLHRGSEDGPEDSRDPLDDTDVSNVLAWLESANERSSPTFVVRYGVIDVEAKTLTVFTAPMDGSAQGTKGAVEALQELVRDHGSSVSGEDEPLSERSLHTASVALAVVP
jgi:hypothetical protein